MDKKLDDGNIVEGWIITNRGVDYSSPDCRNGSTLTLTDTQESCVLWIFLER